MTTEDGARLKSIFEKNLDCELPEFGPEMSPLTVAGWDSIRHTDIVLAIEETFGFEFTLEEIARLESVGDFLEVMATRGFAVA
jgi:acyl carrier protein